MSNISIAINAANDIYVDGNGNLATVTDVYAVQQDCLTVMQSQFGEMVLAPATGLPTLADVFVRHNFSGWAAAARKALLNVSGVTAITSFTYSVSGGVLTYNAIIQTTYSASITVTDELGL